MNSLVLFFAIGLVAAAQGGAVNVNYVNGRIVNGEDVNLGEIPYQVSLQSGSHFCGGSIVNENWIVTAAHCVDGNSASRIKVVVGTISLKEPHKQYESETIIVHEKYAPSDSNRNDIALIKVKTSIEFTEAVQPVALPEPFVKVKTNSSAVVSGWGGLVGSGSPTPDRLQKAKIYIADQEYCKQVMQERRRDIYPTNVCANDPSVRRGQCNGDSGGPLTVDGKLTGIVSWSIKDPYCASTKYPGVYTRVSEYVEWILSHTE